MPNNTQAGFRILIIGGGIAGFASAVGLRRKGHEVTVIERSECLQAFGGSLLIPANALRVIEDYGLLKNFQAVAEKWATHTIYRHDGKVLDILSNEANEKVFGYE
jgi:salicylate hydroxylase